MTTDQCITYAKEIIREFPESQVKVADLIQLMYDELEDDTNSEYHEAELCYNSLQELHEELKNPTSPPDMGDIIGDALNDGLVCADDLPDGAAIEEDGEWFVDEAYL